MSLNDEELIRRLQCDLADRDDEELEMVLGDRVMEAMVDANAGSTAIGDRKSARQRDFRELFRLQADLVPLQDWVIQTGHKMVILFDGRDAAGKGA